MLTPKEIRTQEQLAFSWIVGKLASFSSGLVDIPIQPEEPFVKVLHLFNQKVPSPLDYSTWRKKIYNRVQYIKRRQKEGKRAPLYKPFFLHLLGTTRRGIRYAEEPSDFRPPSPERGTKRKQSKDLFDDEEDEDLPLKRVTRRSTVQ